MKLIKHFINGQDFEQHDRVLDVYNPAKGQVIAQVGLGNANTVDEAVAKAKEAFKSWSKLSPLKRSRYLFKLVDILNKNKELIAKTISEEHGKVFTDAMGEVQRGIEVAEFVCGIPSLLKGDFSQQIATDMDCYDIRQPLGVCAGITPFNFPFMVPFWMFPVAIACGNTFIIKPSEKDPSATMLIAKFCKEAGIPDGVVNIVNGDKVVVDAILQHKDIKAISFVGSTPIAKYIYSQAAANGKRVQALAGAKNHCVVMPDADFKTAVSGIMGAAYGSAGERCMAIPIVVAVGDETGDKLVEMISQEIDKLKIAPGDDLEAEMGPIVTKEHRDSIKRYIDIGEQEGATLVRDGRNFTVKGYENGFFMGATLFDNVKPNMKIYQEEIFGPVLGVVRVKTLQEAIDLTNAHNFANGAVIYTSNGSAARKFTNEIDAGMVGINVPIPVPLAFHSFGGNKDSLFGDTHIHGKEGVLFYTRLKTVTTRWADNYKVENAFIMPTM
ncbi:MAG: CoA-acylating methylmalonate-semialdehyde dehydrogenase [Francisella sp.]